MRAMLAMLAAAALFTSGCGAKEGPVQWNEDTDGAMAAAQKQAQQTLPVFWRAYNQRLADEGSDYLVKAPFRTAHGGQEFMWIAVSSHSNDHLRGTLLNQPEDVPALKAGAEVTVPVAELADWSYQKAGRAYGNYTTRVMIKRANAEEAAELRRIDLANDPLEPGDR